MHTSRQGRGGSEAGGVGFDVARGSQMSLGVDLAGQMGGACAVQAFRGTEPYDGGANVQPEAAIALPKMPWGSCGRT